MYCNDLPRSVQPHYGPNSLGTFSAREVCKVRLGEIELLISRENFVCRAVDNQFYVALCSPARDLTAGYHAVSRLSTLDSGENLQFISKWGHSTLVDPL
jgi:hypothetical protein